ncbi:CotH kinase family protein [Butyrivibrio sp. AE2015]|uniref:CotH kinase family protein n=1 Tax=Butyrivibrio sp. AE2015 TaxID=1280663 RepID=UPI0003B470A7|nr:CotH kinase family protein [Butyrivibrio sp. AE2015]
MKRNKQLIGICAILVLFSGICFAQTKVEKNNASSPVVISEVCTHNTSAAYDDNGDYGADYIELFNRSDSAVSLLNWGLSDSNKDLRRFILPDISIEPGHCIIVWCNEITDDTDAYLETYVPVDVHGVNFHLSNGERCILTDEDGKVADSVAILEDLPRNKSYVRFLDDLNGWEVSDSSPYRVEARVLSSEKKSLKMPTFSLPGGWFSENVEVELSAEKGDIYYTLDGSDPDETSIKYDGPITVTNRSEEENIYSAIGDIAAENDYLPEEPVDKGTVIKAVAITEDGASDVSSQTYFVGLDDKAYEGLNIVSISFSPDDFFGYDKGIYVTGKVRELFLNKVNMDLYSGDSSQFFNFAKKGRGWEKEVNVEIFSPERELLLEQKAGIRIHGGWTRNQNQKNFQIYAREEYDGNARFNYDFFDNGASYSKLMLRAGGSTDIFVTKLRDAFIQSLVADRAIGTQRTIPCAVFLNGEYWGFYHLQETIGTSYINHYYGVDENNIIIVKNGESRTNSPDDVKFYDEVVSFARDNDMSVEANYRKIEEMVDIQSLIDYYAIETYVGNSDAYQNNYAVWRSRDPGFGEYEDCRWRWLLFDLDDSCGMNMDANTADIDSFVTGNWYDNNPLNGDVLFSALIENQEFKNRFVSSFMEIATNNFRYEDVSGKLWNMASQYSTAIINSNNRFRGDVQLEEYPLYENYEAPYDEADFAEDIGWIDTFFRERADYIIQYMLDDLGLGQG